MIQRSRLRSMVPLPGLQGGSFQASACARSSAAKGSRQCVCAWRGSQVRPLPSLIAHPFEFVSSCTAFTVPRRSSEFFLFRSP